MKLDGIDELVQILARYATRQMMIDPRLIFRDLVNRAELPQKWALGLVGSWTGNAGIDARNLIIWAIGQGTNPANRKYTTLGSILRPLLADVGIEDASAIVAIIHAYNLYLDPRLVDELIVQYQVPLPIYGISGADDVGPEIIWRGPINEGDLQGWFRPVPDFQDVGFLKRGIEAASSICRIDIPICQRTGTGFLIGDNLVLTNYHVLKLHDNDDIEENAHKAQLRFGYFTGAKGSEDKGQRFSLAADQPILKFSPTSNLDYVLLKVEDRIFNATDLKPAPYELTLPVERMGLSILQHPEGTAMKLAVSSDGVTGVYPDKAIIQYVTRASKGSSGAPCFNDDWKVVALHHAQRSRSFGAIREGILFSSIYQEIKDLIT